MTKRLKKKCYKKLDHILTGMMHGKIMNQVDKKLIEKWCG